MHLTIKEMMTLIYILQHSSHPQSCHLESIISNELEHEKNSIKEKYMRQFQE